MSVDNSPTFTAGDHRTLNGTNITFHLEYLYHFDPHLLTQRKLKVMHTKAQFNKPRLQDILAIKMSL